MSVVLDTKIGSLRQGEHLCSVYESTDEMLAQAVPYVKHGLVNGEQCLYVADDHSVSTIRSALEAGGVDVDDAIARGQLKFWGRDDYRQPGDFCLQTMHRFIQRTLREGLELGFSGIRLTVEMTWTLNCGVTRDDLVKWEGLLNTISYPGSHVSFLCQYNARALEKTTIGLAVYVHPTVVLGHEVCPNLYYRSAADVLRDGHGEELEAILSRVREKTALDEHPASNGDQARDHGRLSPTNGPGALHPAANLTETLKAVEQVLGSLPVGVYLCEAPSGRVVYYNRWAELLWGRQPNLGSPTELYCGALKLFRPDGTPLAHDECPMADAVQKGIGVQNADVVVERPDGSRVSALVNITPIRDREGRIIGAVNLVMDVTERKRSEAVQTELVQRLEQSKQELQEKINELEKFEDAVVGRELRMIELERENRELRRRLGLTKEAV